MQVLSADLALCMLCITSILLLPLPPPPLLLLLLLPWSGAPALLQCHAGRPPQLKASEGILQV
jgi:hypothetical protein